MSATWSTTQVPPHSQALGNLVLSGNVIIILNQCFIKLLNLVD